MLAKRIHIDFSALFIRFYSCHTHLKVFKFLCESNVATIGVVFENELSWFQRSASDASANLFHPPGVFIDEAFALGVFHEISCTEKAKTHKNFYTGSGLRGG